MDASRARGPKLGDAASLWNFSPAPGWTKEECLTLKLCLMKFGVGAWAAIQGTGLLPGKLIQQLNGATQRLLGQQSLAAYSGLRVDIDAIRADNAARAGAQRKNGLIIWAGPNPTKEMKARWQADARHKYGLTPEQQAEAEAALAELQAAAAAARPAPLAPLPPDCDIAGCDAAALPTGQQQLLVCALHVRLLQLASQLVAQQPALAPLLTFAQQLQQQQQRAGSGEPAPSLQPRTCQQQSSWIVSGLPTAGQQPACEPDLMRRQQQQGGGGASAAAGAGRKGKPPASSKPSGGKQAAAHDAGVGKKRGRRALGDADDSDEEAAFLQRQQARGSSSRRKGAGQAGSSLDPAQAQLQELMSIALEAGVAQLVDMGYSRSKALDALRECHCDVELAVEFLTAMCC